jgi:hypothetical protein
VAVLRRLLIALLLACPAVVLFQPTAQAACSCRAGNVQTSADRADVVFSGLLDRQSTGPTGPSGSRQTTYEITAERVFKGAVTTANVDVVSPRGGCGLGPLQPDRRYVFFVTESSAEFMTDRCSGTGVASADLVRRVERVLGEGEDVSSPPATEPPAAEFTKVANAEPETLGRLIAPGAALVIVGLLGLLLVGRLSRRET